MHCRNNVHHISMLKRYNCAHAITNRKSLMKFAYRNTQSFVRTKTFSKMIPAAP